MLMGSSAPSISRHEQATQAIAPNIVLVFVMMFSSLKAFPCAGY